MIHRPSISPRVLGLLAGFGLLLWIAGPLAQFILIDAGSSPLGTKLSIGETRVSLLSSELEFKGVTLLSSSRPEQKLLTCDRVSVDVEGTPLLRRKFVVRNANASGVRLHTEPISAAEMSTRWPLPQHWKVHLPAQEKLHATLAQALAAADEDPQASTATGAMLDVLIANWPRNYFDLQNDMGVYELRVERLAELADALTPNLPATQETVTVEPIGQTWQEIRELEEGVLAFKQRVDSLQKDFSKDRQRLFAMKQAELERPIPIISWQIPNPQILTNYFLGAAASERSWEILRFVQWARDYVPDHPENAVGVRTSGLTIAYPERNPLPDFVLRALHFKGTGTVADKTFGFAGTLQNLTNDPQRFSQPIRLVVDAKVPHRVVVEAVLDRRANVPRNRIVVRCPSWSLPAQTLGDPALVAVAARPNVLSLRAELKLTGNNISGIVQMRQQRMALKPLVVSELGGERVQFALAEMVSQLETIDYQVDISGPIDSPAMTLRSPWGEKVAGGLQHAFEQEIALRSSQRAERTARKLDERFSQWEGAALADQAKLRARLTSTLEQVRMLDGLVQKHLPPDDAPRAATIRSDSSSTSNRK